MDQLSIWEFLAELEEDVPEALSEPTAEDFLTVDDIHHIRDAFIVGECQRAFGISRNGRGSPSDEAWQWILSQDKDLPFSFANCCKEFGADPDTAKQMLVAKFNKLFDAK